MSDKRNFREHARRLCDERPVSDGEVDGHQAVSQLESSRRLISARDQAGWVSKDVENQHCHVTTTDAA